MLTNESLNDRHRSVARSIVGDYHFPWIAALLVEKGLHLLVQPRETILDRNDDADHDLNPVVGIHLHQLSACELITRAGSAPTDGALYRIRNTHFKSSAWPTNADTEQVGG